MIDIGSAMGAFGALKQAAEIAKGMLDLKEEAAVREKAIELYGLIMAAQANAIEARTAHAKLIDEAAELKKKLTQFEDWAAEAARYELKEFPGGAYAYTLKSELAAGEPPHHLCANCLPKRQKSILQRLTDDGFYQCHSCSHGFQLGARDSRVRYVQGGGEDGGWMGA